MRRRAAGQDPVRIRLLLSVPPESKSTASGEAVLVKRLGTGVAESRAARPSLTGSRTGQAESAARTSAGRGRTAGAASPRDPDADRGSVADS